MRQHRRPAAHPDPASSPRHTTAAAGTLLFPAGPFPAGPFHAGTARSSRPRPQEVLHGLGLDLVVALLTAGPDDQELTALFSTVVTDRMVILHRQEIFADFELGGVPAAVSQFLAGMRQVRAHRRRAGEAPTPVGWRAGAGDAAAAYVEAVTDLGCSLAGLPLASRGLQATSDRLVGHLLSDPFRSLREATRRLGLTQEDTAGCATVDVLAVEGFRPAPWVARLDRELRFFAAYLDVVAPLRALGQPVCFPVLATGPSELVALDTVELATALELAGRGVAADRLDLRVAAPPEIDPQTPTDRAAGQLVHFAALGCPVPGRTVRLHLPAWPEA